MRKHLSLREVKKMFPGAEKELLIDMDEEALEESDLSLFTYKRELYAESHDEYSLAVFRGRQVGRARLYEGSSRDCESPRRSEVG